MVVYGKICLAVILRTKKIMDALVICRWIRDCWQWTIFSCAFIQRLLPPCAVSFAHGSASKWVLISVVLIWFTQPVYNIILCGLPRQIITVFILFVLINSLVTLFAASLRNVNSVPASNGHNSNYNSTSNSKWLQNGETAKYISIEVLSSKDRVRICVDDATVIIISWHLVQFIAYLLK